MITKLVFFSACCCLVAGVQGSGPLNPRKVTASAECGGELRIRLHVKEPAAETHSIDKRDADEDDDESLVVFEVMYRAAGEEKGRQHQFAAHSTDTKGQYETLLSGLHPGQEYSLRVRVGESSDLGDVEFGEFSSEVRAVSGKIIAEDGPVGVGEGRSYCRSRSRKSGKVFKMTSDKDKSRLPRYTFSRRRNSGYYCSYYSSYNYYSYCSSGGTTVGGIIAGVVVGVIFLVAAFIICCKFYFYGGCGRQPYRRSHVVTSTMHMSTVPATTTAVHAPQAIPVAQPVATNPASAYPGASSDEKGMHSSAPYPTAAADSGTYGAAMYPPAPTAAAYPVAPAPVAGYPNPGYPASAGYPAAAGYPATSGYPAAAGGYPNAPPGYDTAVAGGKY